MATNPSRLIYLGHTDSTFTKCFVPVLAVLPKIRLVCVFVDEPQRLVWPDDPNYLLKIFILVRELFSQMNRVFMAYYWKIYGYHKSVDVYFLRTTELEIFEDLACDSDYLLTAGMQLKLPQVYLSKFNKRVVNFHYSLLPKHRGTMPVFWQKRIGDHAFGYTFHVLTDKLDAGEILLQERLLLQPRLPDSIICDLLTRHASLQLPRLFGEELPVRMQDESQASYHSWSDYVAFVNVTFSTAWFSNAGHSNRWILQRQYVIHTGDVEQGCSSDGVHLRGYRLFLCLEGKGIELKRVNYLPAVFYFWPIKKIFAQQRAHTG